MITVYLGNASPVVKLAWVIYKGSSWVLEDFSRARVNLWIVGACNKWLVACTAIDGVIHAEIPRSLPVGVYGVRAMWVKNDCCCKRTQSEVNHAFMVTNVPGDATPIEGDECVIHIKSWAATYGYDGLSAYEMAVLAGKTHLSEDEWMDSQNQASEKYEILIDKIDGMLVNDFGNSTDKAVSQKTLTDAINRIWEKFEDLTGEVSRGISMIVTPTFYTGDAGCDVHVTVQTVDASGIFEHIAFYVNNELVHEADDVDYLEFDTEITDTSVVKCVAQILGVEYMQQKVITRYESFWVGAGATYADVMDSGHIVPLRRHMRGVCDVTAEDGDHIIVVMAENIREGFIRADINGIEIPFNESTVNVDGDAYSVFTSVETYSVGTYNIDING